MFGLLVAGWKLTPTHWSVHQLGNNVNCAFRFAHPHHMQPLGFIDANLHFTWRTSSSHTRRYWRSRHGGITDTHGAEEAYLNKTGCLVLDAESLHWLSSGRQPRRGGPLASGWARGQHLLAVRGIYVIACYILTHGLVKYGQFAG
jgi:hypothetical protein